MSLLSPPAHWIPAFAGKTEGDAGMTEGGAGKTGRRLCTTESTGDGISTVSRWICYRPGPPAHWVPACAGKTEGGAGKTGRRLCTTESTGDGISTVSRWICYRPGPPPTGFPPARERQRGMRERREGDCVLQNQLETVLAEGVGVGGWLSAHGLGRPRLPRSVSAP